MDKQPTENDSVSKPAFWEGCYANEQTGWDRGGVHPALTHWLETEQLSPCSIVIPGCGNGHEAIALAENGFEVTAIDFAKEPLKQLRDKLRGFESNTHVIHTDVFDFTPATKFDAVYEQTFLCAIRPAQRNSYESKVYQWLHERGMLYILFMQTENESDQPPFHCDIGEMRNLFHEDRWIWGTESLRKYEHPSGKVFELATRLERRAR